MASSLDYSNPRFTCKEGILHVLIKNRWKKKWIILSGSSLIIYKKKSKVRAPKFIFDLKKAIAISSPLDVGSECAPIPLKIPLFRGFGIRFNELAAQKIFAAFAFSHPECLQWVQSVRFNTNSTQQMVTIPTPTLLDRSRTFVSYGDEPKRLCSTAEALTLIGTQGEITTFTYPSVTMHVCFSDKTPLESRDQIEVLPSNDLEVIKSDEEIIQNRQLRVRSSSLIEISQLKKIEYECLFESKNIQKELPLPPPYNPNYN